MKFHARCHPRESLPIPLVLGHFVPWYTLNGADFPLPEEETAPIRDRLPVLEDFRHWNDSRAGYRRTHHHIPRIGRYDSRDPRVIEWQIEQALAFGVSGFILNWYGKYSVENVITLHWLRGLERWNREHPDRLFLYFFSIDSQCLWPSEGKTPVPLEEDFRYLKDHLIRDTYLCRDGRPVFSVFPYENDCPVWRKTLEAVFGPNGADLIWKGTNHEGTADGCYAWVQPGEENIDFSNPCCWRQPDDAGDGFLRSFFANCNELDQPPAYLMAGVWPGFNNQFVAWAWSKDPEAPHIRPSVICRETTKGNTLDLTWCVVRDYYEAHARGDRAARLPMPLIQLVTWNDYAETTTVEPTVDYGETPLAFCRDRLAELKNNQLPKPNVVSPSP